MSSQDTVPYDEIPPDRRVRQLADDGVAIRCSGGFDLIASDRAYIGWLRRDEDGARARRRATDLTAEAIHHKVQRQDRELMTPDEVVAVLTSAMN